MLSSSQRGRILQQHIVELAAMDGIEPPSTILETVVLPLNHQAKLALHQRLEL